MKGLLRYGLLLSLLTSILFIFSCNRDDDSDSKEGVPCFEAAQQNERKLDVTFTNCSENASSYRWDFGDGSQSEVESPVHTYADPGDYTVTLEILLEEPDEDGNFTAEISKSVTVTQPDPFASISSAQDGATVDRSTPVVLKLETFAKFPVTNVKGYMIIGEEQTVIIDSTLAPTEQSIEMNINAGGLISASSASFQVFITDQKNNTLESNTITVKFEDKLTLKNLSNTFIERKFPTFASYGYDLLQSEPLKERDEDRMHIADFTPRNDPTINKQLMALKSDTRLYTLPSDIGTDDLTYQYGEELINDDSWNDISSAFFIDYEMGSLVMVQDQNAETWWVIEITEIKEGAPMTGAGVGFNVYELSK
jgi:PKD repeat protein